MKEIRNPLLSPQLGDMYRLADRRRVHIVEFQTDAMDKIVTIVYHIHNDSRQLGANESAIEEHKDAEALFIAMLAREKAEIVAE